MQAALTSGLHCGLARPESLPTLKDWDTRRGPPGLRAAVLQREFEALGGSPGGTFALSAGVRGSHHRVRVEIGEEDGHSPQAPSKSPSKQPPSALCHLPPQAPLPSRFGLLVNVLELHIAEVQANRAARQLRSRARNLLSPRVRVVPSRAAPASRGHVAQARPRVSAHRGRARAMPLLPDSPRCHRPHTGSPTNRLPS